MTAYPSPPQDSVVAALEGSGPAGAYDPAPEGGNGNSGGWWARIGHDLPIVISAALQVGDAVVILVMGILAYIIRHSPGAIPSSYLALMAITAFGSIEMLRSFDLYRVSELLQARIPLRRLMIAWSWTLMLVLAALFFLQLSSGVSRIWMALWWSTALLGMVGLRLAASEALKRAQNTGLLARRVAVVGAGDIGHWLMKQLDNPHQLGRIQIVGIFDDRAERLKETGTKLQILGTIPDLVTFLRVHHVDIVVIALPSQAEERLNQIVRQLRVMPVEVHICPGRIGFSLDRSEVVSLGGVPLLKVVSRPLDKAGWLVKQVEDWIVAALVILVSWPLFAAIALAIRFTSPGPVLYVQQRVGLNGRIFRMYKFRTMRMASAVESATVRQARPDDDRVTAIGRLLRRTSLDELPQFFNVLKGDMSVVGPRPHALRHDAIFTRFVGNYPLRTKVLPGITGWAQINGFRGLTDTEEKIRQRVEFDLWYIDNWSLSLDMRIILLTIFGGMTNRNAF